MENVIFQSIVELKKIEGAIESLSRRIELQGLFPSIASPVVDLRKEVEKV